MMTIQWSPRRCRARAAALVCAALALASCSDPFTPLPREGAPRELAFTVSGMGSISRYVELRGETVVAWSEEWPWEEGAPADTMRVVPGAAAWRDFWAAAGRSGVSRWHGSYVAEQVYDGTQWSLLIAHDGHVLESSGSNAYPDREGREHEMEMTDDFVAFRAALGELIGRPF